MAFPPKVQPQWNIRPVSSGNTRRIEALVPGQSSPVGHVDVLLNAGQAQINNPQVRPEFRRQAIGSGLMQRAMQLARSKGCAAVSLTARPNAPGLAMHGPVTMHSRLGFRTAGMTAQGQRMEYRPVPAVQMKPAARPAAPSVYRPSAPPVYRPVAQPKASGLWRLGAPPRVFQPGLHSPAGTVQRMLATASGGFGPPPPPFPGGGGFGGTPAAAAAPDPADALTQNQLLWLRRAQGNFGTGTFSTDEWVAFVTGYGSLGHEGALRVLRELRRAGVLFPPIEGRVREGIVFSLDAGQAQSAPPSGSRMNNREAYGMGNPSHDARSMVPFWAAHAQTPPPPGRDEREHYMSPSRHYRVGDNAGGSVIDPTTGQQLVLQGHQNAVMGHLPSASTYINAGGHQYSPGTNRRHNASPSAYGQVEERRASAASGAHEPRYDPPSPSVGSWPGYWNSDHPRFNPNHPSSWDSHIRRQCQHCNHNLDLRTATHCSNCGAAY
jgi:hypothetical protein